MVVFFQPTFHKYFLEQAQRLNPNLAYSFSDVIEFTCLGFCLPHLPSGGRGRAAWLSAAPAPVRTSLLQGSIDPVRARARAWVPWWQRGLGRTTPKHVRAGVCARADAAQRVLLAAALPPPRGGDPAFPPPACHTWGRASPGQAGFHASIPVCKIRRL